MENIQTFTHYFAGYVAFPIQPFCSVCSQVANSVTDKKRVKISLKNVAYLKLKIRLVHS